MTARRFGAQAAQPAGGPGSPPARPPAQAPAGLLFVAVRRFSPYGCSVRLFRAPDGSRTAVAFTSAAALAAELGRGQAAVRLSLPALRALLEPLGISSVAIDPVLRPFIAVAAPRTDPSHAA